MKKEIKQVTITPEYANELLRMNINNRNVRQTKVDALAASMKKGEWELSNDAITVSEGNILLNGQHRLMAVVQSGVPCEFILLTGVSDSSFDIMDTPTLRRVSDVLQRKGGSNTVRAEATISKYLAFLHDKENGYETLTRYDASSPASASTRREKIKAWEKLGEYVSKWLTFVDRAYTRGISLAPIAQVAALCMFLEIDMKHPEEKIKNFLEELFVADKVTNKTCLYVRKKLIRHKMKSEILHKNDILRFVVRAWNDFLLGREASLIVVSADSFNYIIPL
jgi:hypothetical protein